MLPMVEIAINSDSANARRFRNQRATSGPKSPNDAPPNAAEKMTLYKRKKCQ